MEKYSVHIKTDEAGNVVDVISDIFREDLTGWTKIDEGEGVKYLHAQGNYFPKPIRTEIGVCRYRLVDGAVQELSDEEIAAVEADFLIPAPSQEQRIQELEEALEMLLAGVTE